MQLPTTNGHTSRPPQRSMMLSFVTLIRTQIEDALFPFFRKETFQVKVSNQSDYAKEFQRLIRRIEQFNGLVNTFPASMRKDQERIQLHISKEFSALSQVFSQKIAEVSEAIVHSKYESPDTKPIVPVLEDVGKNLYSHLQEVEKAIRESVYVAPKVQKVTGDVTVTNQESFPLKDVLKALKEIETSVRAFKVDIPKPEKVVLPAFPKVIQMEESKAILSALADLRLAVETLPEKMPQTEFPTDINVANFPPQKYPIPPNNININPLRGFAKSRTITVGTSLTPLPDEVLSYRRSLVVYNNSSSVTLYIGGSDVTTTNGMPVPPNSYSPAIDAGPRMIVYGIAASSINVRTLELSNDKVGSD